MCVFLIRLKNFEHKRFCYSLIQGEFIDSLFFLEKCICRPTESLRTACRPKYLYKSRQKI